MHRSQSILSEETELSQAPLVYELLRDPNNLAFSPTSRVFHFTMFLVLLVFKPSQGIPNPRLLLKSRLGSLGNDPWESRAGCGALTQGL